jgi:DNA mismatch repair protein MSH6
VVADTDNASRFSKRYSSDKKFSFMWPSNIRDANKRRPSDADYDPSTCYLPPDWFKEHRVSDGQRQWWEFKTKYWDAVMLFKMGKYAPS